RCISALTHKGRCRKTATPLRRTAGTALPEEVVDHVHDPTVPRVDQDGVIVIADPAIARRRVGQPVLPRVAEPVAAAEIARPQPPADLIRPVAPAERVVIEAEVEQRPVAPAVIPPVVPLVVAPVSGAPARPVRVARLDALGRLGALVGRVADDRHAIAEHGGDRSALLAQIGYGVVLGRFDDLRAVIGRRIPGAHVADGAAQRVMAGRLVGRLIAAADAADEAMVEARLACLAAVAVVRFDLGHGLPVGAAGPAAELEVRAVFAQIAAAARDGMGGFDMGGLDMGLRLAAAVVAAAIAAVGMDVRPAAAILGRGLGAGFAMAALMVAGIAGRERGPCGPGEEDEGKELRHGSSPVVTLLRRLVLLTR